MQDGKTALDHARTKGHTRLIKLLDARKVEGRFKALASEAGDKRALVLDADKLGDNAATRCRSIALNVCLSASFEVPCCASTVAELEKLQADLDKHLESATQATMLLWIDLWTAVPDKNKQALVAQIKELLGKYPLMKVLVTSTAEMKAMREYIWDELGCEDMEGVAGWIGPQEEPMGVTAADLHEELRLRAYTGEGEGDGRSTCLLETVGADALRAALTEVLPGDNRPLAALFTDGNARGGSTMVKICVSDVAYLQVLRDQVLLGDFDKQLSAALGRRGKPPRIRADRSDFAERIQRCYLGLFQLTPHQQSALESCEGKTHVHAVAPAGAGKTFVALAEALRTTEAGGSVLFIARNPALTYFVGKWARARLMRMGMSSRKRRGIMARLHVLFDASKLGFEDDTLKRFTERDGRLEPEDAPAPASGYDMVIVDEAHHVYRDERFRGRAESYVREGTATRRWLLSDISQSRGKDIEYPGGMERVVLKEIVRSTKRIVAGAMVFQLGDEEGSTCCHNNLSAGAPLKSFIYDAPADEADRTKACAAQVMRALLHLRDTSTATCP